MSAPKLDAFESIRRVSHLLARTRQTAALSALGPEELLRVSLGVIRGEWDVFPDQLSEEQVEKLASGEWTAPTFDDGLRPTGGVPASPVRSARAAARARLPLDGADAQALEGALGATEHERDEARAEAAVAHTTARAAVTVCIDLARRPVISPSWVPKLKDAELESDWSAVREVAREISGRLDTYVEERAADRALGDRASGGE